MFLRGVSNVAVAPYATPAALQEAHRQLGGRTLGGYCSDGLRGKTTFSCKMQADDNKFSS